ncbi:MAG: L,D-transpeptidase family protein [Pseudomonadota bacterium]
MKRRSFILAAPAVLTGAEVFAARPKIRTYDGPMVTQITIHKGARRMYLLNGTDVMKTYKVKLGINPVGHKQYRGDNRTPEGLYLIDRKNDESRYHLSLGLSYPNRADWDYARSIGKHPGGDIFIHGGPSTRKEKKRGRDWTAGCIAVKDREMEEIYPMIDIGTLIHLTA